MGIMCQTGVMKRKCGGFEGKVAVGAGRVVVWGPLVGSAECRCGASVSVSWASGI